MKTYHEAVSAPDPLEAVRNLPDGWLCQLIDDLRAVEHPNEFQARVFAWAMCEAVERWRAGSKQEGGGDE